MTGLVIAAVIALACGWAFVLAGRPKAETLKPAPQMTFPVTPSEGDRYASSNGSWVFTVKGWELG